MEDLFIINGEIYSNGIFQRGTLEIRDGKIHFHNENEKIPEYSKVIDANGKRIVPGFIDIHTHGAVGVDVNSASADDLEKIGCFFAGNGTTSWLASILTDSEEKTSWCIQQYNQYKNTKRQGAKLMGLHLEGPFLSPDYKGAMPENFLQKGNIELIKKYQDMAHGGIRYITVSPEVDGVLDIIPKLSELGITVSMGHSGADYDTAMSAIEKGVKAVAHTGNAMRLLHQHEPAIFGAALESDIYCEIICDGRHLHPGTVRLIVKAKGNKKTVAITDSIMATGLPDGYYHLGVNKIVVENGDAKLVSNGTRAGSTLTQNNALKNLLSFTDQPLENILPMLTENPAKLIDVYDTKGTISEGKDADIVVLDKDNDVDMVFVGGELVSLAILENFQSNYRLRNYH
jgi:N-acetylglucosamine-6-phosphate deacetylase